MTNRIQEQKIIAMQAVIFLSLLVMLSFILEGCAVKDKSIESPEIHEQSTGMHNTGTSNDSRVYESILS